MNLPRLWRTGRYLSMEQVSSMLARRLRHAAWRRRPVSTWNRVAAMARTLPLPDPGDERLALLAPHVQLLQATMHGRLDGVAEGRFHFLGRSIDFGGLDHVDWRRDLGEESSPLWRLTLAYFGWAVPLVGRRADALSLIAAALGSFERSSDWSRKGVFRDLWNPYTASHRLINLLIVAALHRAAGGASGPEEAAILGHVRFCAAYIAADLERDLQFNHLLKNYVALAVFAAAAPAASGAFSFLEAAVLRLLSQIQLDDGGHAERSPMYHALGLLDLRLLRDSGVFAAAWRPELDRRIAAAERALSCLVHPDGDIALFADSWFGGAPPAARLELPELEPGLHVLSNCGYARLSGNGDCAILDRGAIGADQNPAHGHADYLAVEVSIHGQRLLVDFGTPTYVTGSRRDHCRSAAAHNGPRLVGAEPAELWKSFRIGRRGRAGSLHGGGLDVAPLWAAGWQDGYAHLGSEVRRWIGLWPGQGFVIVDAWKGGSGHVCVSDFLVPDAWQVVCAGASVDLAGPVRLDATALIGRLQVAGNAEWWPRYGESEPATMVRLWPEGSLAALAVFRQGIARPLSADDAHRLGTAVMLAQASTASSA